jgi:hypothetical protein
VIGARGRESEIKKAGRDWRISAAGPRRSFACTCIRGLAVGNCLLNELHHIGLRLESVSRGVVTFGETGPDV